MTLAWSAAGAQTITEPGESDYPRFTVEVIIFEYTEDVSIGTERFLPEAPPLSGPDELVDGELVFGDTDDTDAVEAVEADGPELASPEFVLHPEEEFTMTDIARRLERLDVYRPVMHFAWTQATPPEEKTRPIELNSLAQPPDNLDGSVLLYLSRYLHLVVDLSLEQPSGLADPAAAADNPASVYQDGRGGEAYGDFRPAPVLFRIAEDRIFKSGELRYFDHPKFGVLAKVTRVEEPDDASGETGLVGELGQ